MVDRIWKPGCGSQDVEAENVAVAAARVTDRPSRSGFKDVQKRRCLQNVSEFFFLGSRAKEKNNDSRKRFIDIGLENVVVAAAHVVEGPSRSGLRGVQKRRCLQNVGENHLFDGIWGEFGPRTGASLE